MQITYFGFVQFILCDAIMILMFSSSAYYILYAYLISMTVTFNPLLFNKFKYEYPVQVVSVCHNCTAAGVRLANQTLLSIN